MHSDVDRHCVVHHWLGVQTLEQDLYNGISAAFAFISRKLHSRKRGRAGRSGPGLENLCAAALHTLRIAEKKRDVCLGKVSSQTEACWRISRNWLSIWTYLMLAHWKLDADGDGIQQRVN